MAGVLYHKSTRLIFAVTIYDVEETWPNFNHPSKEYGTMNVEQCTIIGKLFSTPFLVTESGEVRPVCYHDLIQWLNIDECWSSKKAIESIKRTSNGKLKRVINTDI
jgi:hypothetical protein